MTIIEMEETLALQYAQVPEVPAKANKSTAVWIYGIAKIKTRTGRESWAVVRSDYGRDPHIIKVFNDEGVAEILSVHPYKFLDKKFVPKLTKAEDTKAYIARVYGVSEERVKDLKKEELQRLLYTHCIKAQLEYEKSLKS